MRSQTAKLTVYVPPEPPEITQGPVVTTTAGAGVQLTCISKGGKPAAEVSEFILLLFVSKVIP